MKQKISLNFVKNVGFSLFLLLMGFGTISAQTEITGIVTDDTGVGVPGVNILIKNSTDGTVTELDGDYSIEASPTDVLVFSFIGYTTQEITVGSKTTIDVQLAGDAEALDEVVVIGYGTVKKKDLTGSVSQVSAKSFEDQPLSRTEEALQGRAAGVTVARSSGAPGAGVKVRIRGANSITGGNDPLVVVDGVIGGDLASINPNDIAAMDVLKDASATAIYGSRGSNGVILITTKKGSGKTTINLDYFISVDQIPKYIPRLSASEFAVIENIRRTRTGGEAIFSAEEIASLEASGGTDYQKEIFQQGLTNNVQLSVSGGEGKVNYFLSGNYVNQEGMLIETGYERASIRSNVGVQVNDKLKVGLNLFGTRSTRTNDLDSFGQYQGTIVSHGLGWDPTTPIYDENGDYNNYSNRALASLNYNPVANMRQSLVEQVVDRLDAQFTLGWTIIPDLTYNLIAGITTINNTSTSWQTEPPKPDARFGNTQTTRHQVSNVVTWHKVFSERHDFKITGVYEFSGGETKYNAYSALDLPLDGGFYLAELAEGKNMSNNYSKTAVQSFMARAEYIFNESLYATGTIRADQSSVFREDNRTGYFPSAALAYSFNKMNFIESGNVVTNLKLRLGWGQVGNQGIAAYSTYPTVNTGGGYAFNGSSLTSGSFPDGYGNPDLKWETTTQTNLGVDLGFWNGRANFSIDVYNKNTDDLLLRVPVPDTNGGGEVLTNIGQVDNNGVDLVLSGTIIQGDNFTWDANFNFSYFQNEVTDLGGVDEIQGTFESPDGQSRIMNTIQVGESLGQFQGYTFLGTWKTAEAAEAATYGRIPGDAKYLRDADGERVYGVIGNGTPNTTWGFNNTLNWRNWDANIFFQGTHGFDVYNAQKGMVVGATGNVRSFLHAEQLNQWTPENETDIPAGGQNEVASSRYVENGSFVRLQNLTIGYTFQDLKGIDFLKLYAGGQNLFLITDYSGYDPEHTSRPANFNQSASNRINGDVAAGINTGAYPNPRTLTFGVKLAF